MYYFCRVQSEKIPEEDRVKISSVINYENLKTQVQWITNFRLTTKWTVDRERNAYIIFVIGGGREELYDYYALGIDGQAIVFTANRRGTLGNDTIGLKEHWNVYNLNMPLKLEPRREEIKQLICEGLEEMAYFRPLADGGSPEHPNTIARGNIISFEVEFK